MTSANARALDMHPVSGFFARAESVRAPVGVVTIGAEHGRAVRIGGRAIDPGTYQVRLDEPRERIVLENDARTYALTAFFRRARDASARSASAWLEGSEDESGARRFLVVRLTSGLEWVA